MQSLTTKYDEKKKREDDDDDDDDDENTKKNAFVRLTPFPDTYPMTRFIRKRKKCQHKICGSLCVIVPACVCVCVSVCKRQR